MKHLIAILLVLFATNVVAQDESNTVREYKNKVFDVHNRDPRDLLNSIKLLGSGFKGSGISINQEMHTITVRDFPENVAAIEEAITRLDHAPAAEPDIELKISVLIGSKTPLNSASVPDELAAVVKQLQSTLRYSHYGLMTATIQRTRAGRGVQGSGVAEPTLLGMTPQESRPIMYTYDLDGVTVGVNGVDVSNFKFSMRIPINVGGNNIQYQAVGFETPVSLKPNEKVVIGTTTMGEKALIVVVTATVTGK